MRRLIFLLIDVDGPTRHWLGFVCDSLKALLNKWRRDPYAIEYNWVSIILIADPPVQVFPPTELMEIDGGEFPSIISEGQSSGSLGQAFKLAADCIQAQRRPRTATDKGDYPAIVLSMVGNASLLDISHGSSALASTRPGISSVCCFSDATFNAIKDFADDVSQLKPDTETVAELFRATAHHFLINYEEGVRGSFSNEPSSPWRNQVGS